MSRQATGYDKRGSNDFRPSRIRAPFQTKESTSSLVADAGKYFTCCEDAHTETREDHIVPRVSLTQKLHLGLFPQQVETEPLRQRDKVSGELVAAGERVTWRSDRTLLRRNKPEQLEDMRLKRQTSRSKRIINEPREEPATIEIPTPDALDLDAL